MLEGLILLKKIYTYLSLLTSILLFSQNQNTKWYFGNGHGLDFMTTPPTTLTGAMNAPEGCSSIADASGNLLFYTDGITIYNASHQVMSNGSGLNGDLSSTQSGLIVKKPGSQFIYFVFSNKMGNGLWYSEVDMNLSSGQGSVTTKNVPVISGCNEQLTAARHSNGVDYWVVYRDYNSGSPNLNYHSILVSASGVGNVPVISPVGHPFDGAGYFRISHKGNIAASAGYWFSGVKIYNFNSTTGVLSNSVMLLGGGGYYGCEFSPDGTKLFVSHAQNKLYQWDLCAGSASAIAATMYTFGTTLPHAMQLAPDGKIYITITYTNIANPPGVLDVINNPNNYGSACNYSPASQPLANTLGMSRGITQNIYTPPMPITPLFTYTVGSSLGCQSATFTGQNIFQSNTSTCSAANTSVIALQWTFGDPGSGAANTSTLVNPVHSYTAAGNYTTTLIVQYCCGAGFDTVQSVVNILHPCISVLSNSITCSSLGTATASPSSGGVFSYTWLPSNQTGSTVSGLNPGTHTLLVLNQGNNASFTTSVTFVSPILLTAFLNNQTNLLCNAAANGTASYYNIQGGSATQNYWWSNGTNTFTSTSPTITTLSAGIWSATVTDALTGCQVSDLFMVLQPPAQTVNITASTPTTCAGTSISFTASASGGTGPGYTYSWTNSNNSVSVESESVAGTYSYTVISRDANNCPQPATVSVDFVPNPTLVVSSVSVCPLQTGTLSVSGASNYTWSVNSSSLSNSNSWADSPSVTTVYSIDGEALGCTWSATAAIILKTVPVPIFNNNSPLCAGQTLMLYGNGGVAYAWDGPQGYSGNGSPVSMPLATVNHSGVYNLTVTAANNCTASASRTIIVKPLPTVLATASGSAVCLNASTVSLFAAGTATLFSWSPGAGLSSTSGSSVNASPIVNKTYTVTGILNGCAVAQTLAVAVVPPPSLTVVLSSPSLCAQAFNGSPNSITLTASGANAYTLNTPPHIISNSGPPVSVFSTQPPYTPGVATATLSGSNGVCTVTRTVLFTVIPNPNVSVVNPTPVICSGDTYTYTSQGATSYTWSSVTPGSTLYTSPGVAVASPSINSVFSVYGASVGCMSASHQFSITVNPLPSLSVTPQNTAVCTGSAAVFKAYGTGTSYQWYPPAFLNSSSSSSVISTPKNNQSYTVVSTLNSCTVSASASVSLLPLPKPGIVAQHLQVCLNDSITLRAQGGVGYAWDGPQQLYATGETLSFKASNTAFTGNYTLTATDIHGCVGTTMTPFVVNALPYGYLASSRWQGCVPFCTDMEVISVSNNITAMSWQVRGLTHTGNFRLCVGSPGDYIIYGSLTDDRGCVNTASYVVKGLSNPVADFEYSPEKPIENFDEVLFTSTSGDVAEQEWITGTSKYNEITSSSFSKLYPDAGIYPVTLVVKNDKGCRDTITKNVIVLEDFAVYVPNAFTPNEDGKNETFVPVLRGVKKFEFSVFDRLGHVMFTTTDVNRGWDGTSCGELCKQDVYAWRLVVSSRSGEMKELTGSVVLIR
jgi:gliding motility-associated-like protein